MTVFIVLIESIIAGAIANATALVASDLGQILMFFLGVYLLYKFIAMVRGANKTNV